MDRGKGHTLTREVLDLPEGPSELGRGWDSATYHEATSWDPGSRGTVISGKRIFLPLGVFQDKSLGGWGPK